MLSGVAILTGLSSVFVTLTLYTEFFNRFAIRILTDFRWSIVRLHHSVEIKNTNNLIFVIAARKIITR